jgi:clan AA aspartic protease
MGETREQVTLTNAVEQGMARRGILPPGHVRQIVIDAIVDTGAVRSVLPQHVADQLGLQIVGQQVAQYADGRTASVGVTEPVVFQCQARTTLEEALVLGTEVLIGQTVLEKLDLLADCVGRRLVPHPGRPNQPVSMVR